MTMKRLPAPANLKMRQIRAGALRKKRRRQHLVNYSSFVVKLKHYNFAVETDLRVDPDKEEGCSNPEIRRKG